MSATMMQRAFRSSLLPLALAGAAVLLPFTLPAQTITSYAPTKIPQTNATTGTQPTPYRIVFTGTGFLTSTTAKFTWAGGSGTGAVHYVSATSVVVTLPTTIPSTVTSVTPSLCNGASCATGANITIIPLADTTRTLKATPNPTGFQPVVLASTFTPYQPPASPTVTGVPTGTVTFTDNGTSLGTSKLLLDPVNSSFIQNGTTPVSEEPYSQMYTADFNGDGIPDVVFFDGDDQIHVVLGTTPYGSFQPELVYNEPGVCIYLSNIGVGDLNNDGFSDLVVSCGDNSGDYDIYSMLSNGDGTFAAPVLVDTVYYTTAFALGDMNKDGKLDLVLQGAVSPPSCVDNNNCVDGLAVLTGNGDGTFSPSYQVATTFYTYPIILLADIDHDGYLDIVGFNGGGEEPSALDIYLSHSATSYGVVTAGVSNPSASVTLSPFPYSYSYPFTADFNGDGLPDLGLTFLYYNESGDTYGISTWLNTSTPGNASFGAPANIATSGPSEGITVADLNGDGFPDLADNSNGSGQFFENDGKGNFANTYTNLSLPANSVLSLAAADINDDGVADLIVVPNAGSAFSVVSYITTGQADANFTFTPTQDGPNLITAVWPGNVDFVTATPTYTLTVNGDSTATSISSNHTTTEYGESVTISSTVTSPDAGTPTGTITFLDGTTTLATVNLSGGTASYTTSAFKVGKHIISAIYSGDMVFAGSTSGNTVVSVNQAQPVISWTPVPATITYGTALVAGQLDATAATTYFTSVPGTFHYTPAVGTVLTAGTQTLNVSFTPTDAVDFAVATGSTTITVNKATPTINWTPPAAIVVGTPLSSTQLNATATGPLGAVAGAFTYTPPAGTILPAGANQALNVQFAPTDTTDYTTATGSTTITVIPLAITSLAPSSVVIGSAATVVTLTGTGFLPNSVINVNGTAAATTFISATSLSTTIPATSLLTVQTLSITVTDPTQGNTSPPASFSVTAPAPAATFTGPTTTTPGEQPSLDFSLTSSYPIPITGTLTLTFAGSAGVDDPSIQFASGGRTLTFNIPANSTTAPTIQLQSGTDAGVITVTLVLTAGGVNITPASIVPIAITIPPAAPTVTSMTLARSGNTITASIIGFSDTRELTQATFHFTAAPGASLNTPDLTIPVAPLFTTWYSGAASDPYGSTFLYTQQFNLSGDPSTVGSITVTLTNSAGTSTSLTAQ
jgi:hypothetical protein